MQLPQAPDRCILGQKRCLHHDVHLRVISRIVSLQAEPVCAIICALFFVRSATDDWLPVFNFRYLSPSTFLPFPPPTITSSTSSADTTHSSLPHFEDSGVRNTPRILDRHHDIHAVSNDDISSACRWRMPSSVLVGVEETESVVVVLSRHGATGESDRVRVSESPQRKHLICVVIREPIPSLDPASPSCTLPHLGGSGSR